LVIFAVVEMARGWRPLFDNAEISLRSYQVFSLHSPLVGHEVALPGATQPVFSPGPLENWLLAVPVRLDPGQGALWGAVVVAVGGVALAIEAGWSTARWWGAVVVTASILTAFAVRGDLDTVVVWNAWLAVIFLYTTLASAWATAAGHLRWWPVSVLAASVVAQCQEVFAWPAILVCLASLGMGVVVCGRRDGRVRLGPLVAGASVAVVVWVAPVIQQFTHHPGNFTLLWRAAHQPGATLGLSQALRALGSGISVPPSWVHAPPLQGGAAGFYYVVLTFAGPLWWAAVALGLLAVVAIGAAVARRTGLVAAAMIAFVAAVGTVASIATVPQSQFLNLTYLGTILIPVGTAVWSVLAWALFECADNVVRRRVGGVSSTTAVPGRTRRAPGLVPLCAIALVAVPFAWSMATGIALIGTDVPTISGWAAVQSTDRAVADVARLAPHHRPVRLQLDGHSTFLIYGILTGTAYLLDSEGFDIRLTAGAARPVFGDPSPGMPLILIRIPQDDVADPTATVPVGTGP
jgi:hypothetical protein